jgi:hypothetical protein
MLNWNHRRVRNLSPREIWLFIVGRVVAALGVGMFAALNWPALSRMAAIPLVAVGVVCLIVAGRGLARKPEA